MTTPFNLIMLSAHHEAGGNVTQRMLDSHPQLMVYPFESQIGTPLSRNLLAGPDHPVALRYAYPTFDSETTPESAYAALWDEELKTLLRAPGRSKFKDCGLVMDEEERIAAFVKHCGGPGWECDRNSRASYIEAYFRSTFDTWSSFTRTGRETTYVGYSPPILLDADKLFADFPQAHMVHVIRNPFSGYADTKRRPFPMSLARYCQIWSVTSLMAATYEAKYRGRFHVVRFEDLVADPRGTLDTVTTVCGLEPFATLPRPSFNRAPLDTVYPWGTIRHATTEANLATALELTPTERAAVYGETQEMIARWYTAAEITPYAKP